MPGKLETGKMGYDAGLNLQKERDQFVERRFHVGSMCPAYQCRILLHLSLLGFLILDA